MEYTYWCAACGNPNIIVENTKSGYSMGKGIVGAAVLGPVGAVAGLDGKETAVYYCPKCGAKLNHCMPDYEVSSILRLLQSPELFRSLIEQKHKKYPNMMMPEGWVEKGTASLGTDGEMDFEQLKRILQSSDEYNCGDRLYEYILQYGKMTGTQERQIKAKLNQLKLTKEEKLFDDALTEISNGYGDNYKVKIEHSGDSLKRETIYTAAKDIDEIKAWRLEMKAQKKVRFEMQRNDPDVYMAYKKCVRNLIGDTPVTIEMAEQAILEKNPNINDDNPYMLRQLADTVCTGIASEDARIQFDGEILQVISTKRAEDEIRWEIEEKWKNGLAAEKAALMRKIAPVLKEGKEVSVSDVCDRAGVQPVECTGLLTKLSEIGLCEKNGIYYSLNTEYRGWSVKELGEYVRGIFIRNLIGDLEPTALECLKVNSGKSFWSIMGDHLKSRFQAEQYYKCFMLFELEGIARRTEKSKEYIWEFIDKEAEERKRLEEKKQSVRTALEKEKEQLVSAVEALKMKAAESIPKLEKWIKEARAKTFDGREHTVRISELENRKAELNTKLSSLGFFSFKEKKQINEEIAACNKELSDANDKLTVARKIFDKSIENEVSDYEKERDETTAEIEAKHRKIEFLDSKLKGLDECNSISELESFITHDPEKEKQTALKERKDELRELISLYENSLAQDEKLLATDIERAKKCKVKELKAAIEKSIEMERESVERDRANLKKYKDEYESIK